MESITPAAQAVDALISEYYKLVFHTIYGLTNDWEESQDLTQETFQKALKAIDDARAASGVAFHPRAWLLRIAVNTVRMQHRRRNLFRFIPFSFMQKGKLETGEQETDSDTLTDAAAPVQPMGYGATESADPAEEVAERDAVQRTMARLSEPLRECLLLSILGDFSTSEIATMLDLQEAAVRQRLARARKQFQQFYALESGEQVSDSGIPVPGANKRQEPHKPQRHNSYTNYAGKHKKGEEDVKSTTETNEQYFLMHDKQFSLSRSTYAKRLNREPAATPLW
jgi:RNA polymerase sigma-70 factor, ECF subfamily